MKCHDVDFQIVGDDMQIVLVELDPGKTVIAEAGAMNYLEDNIVFEAKMGDGSQPHQGLKGKLLSAGLGPIFFWRRGFYSATTARRRHGFHAWLRHNYRAATAGRVLTTGQRLPGCIRTVGGL